MPNSSDTTIRGILTRIRWRSPDGNYIIGEFKPNGSPRISILGSMAEPVEGQVYEVSGNYKANHRFGTTDLHFYTYRTILPDDRVGIYNYLIRTAKWVGPEIARALIEKYGDDTLAILKTDPDRVIYDNIRGLPPARVHEMAESLRGNERLEAAMIEVGNLIGGILGPRTCEKAIKKWGADAAHIVRRTPHRLAEIRGVGFLKSDNVYMRLGGSPDALRRHVYAALHVLDEQAAKHGHTIIDESLFTAELTKLIGTLHPRLREAMVRVKGLAVRGEKVCSMRLFESECRVANRIREIQRGSPDSPRDRWTIESVADPAAREMLAELEPDQFAALNLAMNNLVSIITGAPGTGKTFTIARLIVALRAATERVMLVAPTGKAAKQIERALANTVPAQARTIHSALEPTVIDDEFVFARNADNPLDCSTLIVDETSMVDTRLMASLLRAVPSGCRLVLVGDRWQLPSVGPGAVLRDLVAVGLPCVELTKIKRNAGLIVRACHRVKDGKIPQPVEKLNLETGDNWRHIQTPTPTATLAIVEKLLSQVLKRTGVDPTWQTQIISPVNSSGPLSCDALNRIARSILNPLAGAPAASQAGGGWASESGGGDGFALDGDGGDSVGDQQDAKKGTHKKLAFAVNDKIVRCRNGTAKTITDTRPCPCCDGTAGFTDCVACFGKGILKSGTGAEVRIVNGDIGVVRRIDAKSIDVDFFYPDRSVRLPRNEHELKLAYCMTCHKMQGSEIDVVVMPVSRSMLKMPLVTREWVYTAMSRAKKFLVTIGDLSTLPNAIANVGNTKRQTGLKELIRSIE